MQRDEMQKRRRDVMVACPFILPGHLLLGVVGVGVKTGGSRVAGPELCV